MLERLQINWRGSPWIVWGIGILLLVTSWQVFNFIVWSPTRAAWQQHRVLQGKIADSQQELSRANTAHAYWVREQATCLTGDPVLGVHRYQQWLLRRTQGVPNVRVDAMPAIAEGDWGWLASFQIEGVATLAWLAQLVDEIQHTQLQHRIAYLKIDDASASGEVHFACTLEALFMDGAETMEAWPAVAPNASTRTLAKLFETRRPFARGYKGPQVEPQLVAKLEPASNGQPIPPPVDPLSTLKLIGLVSIDGEPQAWIVDSRTSQELRVAQSAEFAFADQSIQLLQIARDAIEIELDSRTVYWPLGESLRSALTH